MWGTVVSSCCKYYATCVVEKNLRFPVHIISCRCSYIPLNSIFNTACRASPQYSYCVYIIIYIIIIIWLGNPNTWSIATCRHFIMLKILPHLNLYRNYSVRARVSNIDISLILSWIKTLLPALKQKYLYSCLQCLFPMQPIRSNAQRVSAALKCLAQEAQCLIGSAPSSETCLLDGLQEVLAQFHRLSHNSKQVNCYIIIYTETYSITCSWSGF